MFLPEVRVSRRQCSGNELFFGTDGELARVLMQDNPVYLVLDLPGLFTSIVVCFPAPTITRVYAVGRHYPCFVGESAKKMRPIWTAPEEVNYRYGMRLVPWMYPDRDDQRRAQDQVVNYIVLNCGVGFTGVNIRLFRSPGDRERAREWLEIHQFSTGNEYRFEERWKEQSRIIVRFVPDCINPVQQMTWQPDGGWEKYRAMPIPCRI